MSTLVNKIGHDLEVVEDPEGNLSIKLDGMDLIVRHINLDRGHDILTTANLEVVISSINWVETEPIR